VPRGVKRYKTPSNRGRRRAPADTRRAQAGHLESSTGILWNSRKRSPGSGSPNRLNLYPQEGRGGEGELLRESSRKKNVREASSERVNGSLNCRLKRRASCAQERNDLEKDGGPSTVDKRTEMAPGDEKEKRIRWPQATPSKSANGSSVASTTGRPAILIEVSIVKAPREQSSCYRC